MKKITCLIIILTMALSMVFVYADSSLSYTLEEIQQQAVINNKQIGLDDLNIKAEQSALNKAKEDAKWLGDAFEPAAALRNKIIREVNIMEAEASLEAASRSKDENISALKLDAYKLGLNIILLSKQVDVENQKLNVLKEQLKNAQAKLKAGKITENDVIGIEYDINSKENDIKNIQEQIKILSLKVKNLLNLDLDDQIVSIKDDLKYEPLDKIDLDSFINDKSSSVEIFSAEEKVKAEQKRVELTVLYYKPGDSTYDSNALRLESAKLDLESDKTNLAVTAKNKYNELLNQKAKVEIADKYLKLCDKKLGNLQTKLKKGVISNEAVLSGKEDDIDAAYQKYLAIYNYSVQKAEFLNLAAK